MPTERTPPRRPRRTGTERPQRETRPVEETPGKLPPEKVSEPKNPDAGVVPVEARLENSFRRYWLSSKQRRARTELIWIGRQQMICWHPNLGEYALLGFQTRQRDGDPWEAEVLERNEWSQVRNCRLGWLGGDDLLAWEPGKTEYRVFRLTRENPGRRRGRKVLGAEPKPAPPLPLQEVMAGNFAYPVRKLASLGRRRLLAWNDSADTYEILRWKDGRFSNLSSPMRLSQVLPEEILGAGDGHLYFTWAGRNNVVAWNSQTQKALVLGFTNTLEAIPGGLVFNYQNLGVTGRDYAGPVAAFAYQGSRRLLQWDGKEGFDVYFVRAPEWNRDYLWHYNLEDYLESYPAVQDALTWFHNGLEIGSADWDLHGLERLYTMLSGFYWNFDEGKLIDLSYRRQDPNKAGPDLLARDGSIPVFKPTDAEEIYLAQAAQNLWAEMSGQFGWHLADYKKEELELLLNAGKLFAEHPWNGQKGFRINGEIYGDATPTDPEKSFQQIKKLELDQSTPRESVFALYRWIRNHLCHGPGIYMGNSALAAYGFEGYPPLVQMMTRLPNPQAPGTPARFFAWSGCHSAAGLMVGMARCLNIPARSWATWENDGSHGTHHGVDFPTVRLFSKHSDDFYADTYLLDPTIEPSEIFEPEEDYEQERDRYTRPPTSGENRAGDWQANSARKGLGHPTQRYLSAYFYALTGPLGHSAFVEIVRSSRLSVEQAQGLIDEFQPNLQAAADEFATSSGLAGSAAGDALLQQWDGWTARR